MALGILAAVPLILLTAVPWVLERGHSFALAQGQSANRPWMDKALPPDRRADLVLQEMTIDEKIARG